MITTRSTTKGNCLSCRIRNGIPMIHGHAWGYYASRDGARMLVVECGADHRIRINDTVEIVVLEIGNGTVQVRIDDAANSNVPIREKQPSAEKLQGQVCRLPG